MVNIIKLSVGTENLAGLRAWQLGPSVRRIDGKLAHVTRMWPKREAEIVDGGSIYWVIQGVIQARQRILELREFRGADGVRRCAFMLDPKLIEVAPTARRPFQGWRYLEQKDAPADLAPLAPGETPLPEGLRAKLAEIGVL